jgi:hypothetical protein
MKDEINKGYLRIGKLEQSPKGGYSRHSEKVLEKVRMVSDMQRTLT